MLNVTVSPKYQVVIPKEVRQFLQIKPGQQMQVITRNGGVEFLPDKDISEYRGVLKGMDTSFNRDKDRV